ncbi:hypothetical protein THMIRHAS_17030 [Thiosulfatimonas sediminis]|uniref:DUF2958 domain-containing protein n=1 Tax=Thiosulfatimonas sediminis TaxID=2675054 RepID=A0A6F8PWI2_9GAMM|nr:hypothetical protein [Thiosulfatimonas sediminis]BBP46330.1 hypothetical protein THMIRHAS_17030 [Thiosulfatimonas sediminis]
MSFTDFFTNSNLFCSFLPKGQASFLLEVIGRDEGQFFKDKVRELNDIVDSMPGIYGQDGLGDQAIIYLHYFGGGCDWYITEKDVENPGEEQLTIAKDQCQAFGFSNLGDPQNSEFGYIPISELREHPIIELDFHWEPKTVAEVKKSIGARLISA